LQDYLVAVIVPDHTHVATLAQREGVKYDTADPSNSLQDPAVNKAVLDAITAKVKASGALKGYDSAHHTSCTWLTRLI
jgi:long-subunit acyl-CoA synthetase (AMP-forming)